MPDASSLPLVSSTPAAPFAAISLVETNAAPEVALHDKVETDIGQPNVCFYLPPSTTDVDMGSPVSPPITSTSSSRYDYCGNRVLINSTASRPVRKCKLLLLSAGSNNKFGPLHDALLVAGFECDLYESRNGPQYDLIDICVYDPFLNKVSLGEYAAAIASPDPATFAKWRDLADPPALRDLTGRGRCGKSTLMRLSPFFYTPEFNHQWT